MKIKANCRRCFYGGSYNHNKQLASCECKNVTEPTIIEHDPLFNKEQQYVSRKKWEDECNCEHFIPYLSEAEGDYELEASYTFNTSFNCPFCGNTVYVWDIGIEETALITCDECEKTNCGRGQGNMSKMANEKRLIDANALNWGRCPADGKLVSSWLSEAPTVDAVEVVHGEWTMCLDVDDVEYIECPLCGGQFYDGDNDTFDKPYNYCPNCGAKMDGDGNGGSA